MKSYSPTQIENIIPAPSVLHHIPFHLYYNVATKRLISPQFLIPVLVFSCNFSTFQHIHTKCIYWLQNFLHSVLHYIHSSSTTSEFSCQYAVIAQYTTEFFPQNNFFSYSTNCRSIYGQMKMCLFQRPLNEQLPKEKYHPLQYIRYQYVLLIKMVIPMAGQLEPWHLQGILCANSQPHNCIKIHIGTIRHHKQLGKSDSLKNWNQS